MQVRSVESMGEVRAWVSETWPVEREDERVARAIREFIACSIMEVWDTRDPVVHVYRSDVDALVVRDEGRGMSFAPEPGRGDVVPHGVLALTSLYPVEPAPAPGAALSCWFGGGVEALMPAAANACVVGSCVESLRGDVSTRARFERGSLVGLERFPSGRARGTQVTLTVEREIAEAVWLRVERMVERWQELASPVQVVIARGGWCRGE